MPSSFPPDLQQFVDDQIAQGKYHSTSDVVCDAVRLLRDRELRLKSLRHEIDRGLQQLDEGDCFDLESKDELCSLFEEIEERNRQRSAPGSDAK
jgi:antitoxin ParD1/3/4